MSDSSKVSYVRLGNSGLKVSSVILGCMSYGSSKWQGWVLDEEPSIEHIKYAYSQGINTFDTANVYSGGESEVVLGKAIKAIGCSRESVVILTKVYQPVKKDWEGEKVYPNGQGLSRKHIFDSVQASLKRLDMDYIDVFQCHRFDYETPIEETMQALHDVVQKGWAYQFQAMQNYAITHNLTPFISMQNFHNAAYREEEREMIPTLKMMGVGCIPWSPLCRGFLSRRWDAEETLRVKTDTNYKGRGHHAPDASRKAINGRIAEIATKREISMAQVALAWSLSRDFVTAPIIGTTNLDNLKELLGALSIQLTDEEKRYIEEPYEARSISGHV